MRTNYHWSLFAIICISSFIATWYFAKIVEIEFFAAMTGALFIVSGWVAAVYSPWYERIMVWIEKRTNTDEKRG